MQRLKARKASKRHCLPCLPFEWEISELFIRFWYNSIFKYVSMPLAFYLKWRRLLFCINIFLLHVPKVTRVNFLSLPTHIYTFLFYYSAIMQNITLLYLHILLYSFPFLFALYLMADSPLSGICEFDTDFQWAQQK